MSRYYRPLNETVYNQTYPFTENNHDITYWITAIFLTNLFGACANILLLLVMGLYQPLRRSSSCSLIVHCIAIDLYITAVGVPISIVPTLLGPSIKLPDNYCIYKLIFVYAIYCVSMYASCFLALHRLMAAISPKLFSVFARKFVLISLILLPWIAATVINIIPAIDVGVETFPMNDAWASGNCIYGTKEGSNRAALISYSVFAYIMPTAVMTVSYVVVLAKTKRDLCRKRTSRLLQRRLEISRTLCLSCVWHSLCMYPGTVTNGLNAEDYAADVSLQLLTRFLANSFSAINPVIHTSFHRVVSQKRKMTKA